MLNMSDLTFKLVNELLNRDFIVDGIEPSVVEAVILKVLRINLGTDVIGEKKIHLECPECDESLCHQAGRLRLTENEEEVTCRRCLQSLRLRIVKEQGGDHVETSSI